MNTPALVAQPQTGINLFDPAQFETMQRICKMYAYSDIVPKSYRATGKDDENKAVANCMIAVGMAQRMNADHLMVMQNLDVIQGKPSWSAKFLIARINTCGQFETLDYKIRNLGTLGKIEYVEYFWNKQTRENDSRKMVFDGSGMDNLECVAFTRRINSDKILESDPVTIKMAIEEGWYTKSGSKWKTMPSLMLKYRAAAFWQRVHAPELSLGLITQEEAREVVDVEFVEVKASDKLNEDLESSANKEAFTPSGNATQQTGGQPEPVRNTPNWMR